MTVFKGGKTRGARAAVFFLWIILIFSQLGVHFAVNEETSAASTTNNKSFRSSSRKAKFFSTDYFHPPSISPQFSGNYEDDKRIVHTGPNPLHN